MGTPTTEPSPVASDVVDGVVEVPEGSDSVVPVEGAAASPEPSPVASDVVDGVVDVLEGSDLVVPVEGAAASPESSKEGGVLPVREAIVLA
jgi:hypothetical protein